jgi:hypothetical protein
MNATKTIAVVHAAVDPQTREKLERLAQAADRSLAAEVRRGLRAYVEQEETRK